MTADSRVAPDAASAPAPLPPTTSIRAAPPKPRRLSRKTLMAATLVLGGLIAFALVNGMSERPHRTANDEDTQPTLQTINPPESIREHPANYDLTQLQPPAVGHDFLWGDHPPPDAVNAPTATAPAAYTPPPAPNPLETEAENARTSSILFGRSNGGGVSRPAGGASATAAGPHSSFVNAQAGRDDGVLDATYLPPHSPYTLQSGSTISAALVTALNSDQPGRVIAQVSENVFDSVTGGQLLIPQGARLIGAYDADTNYGEQRLLIVWNRLIMPNGWSIALRGMPGTDASGASGLHGDVDAHLGRIAVASLLSGVLGVAANESQDDNSSRFAQSVGDASAQQAAQTGSRIVDRELDVRPTLRVRVGARVRVLITQDLILRPYHP